MTRRYTIEIAVHEVDEDGDTIRCYEVDRLDYATEDLDFALGIMDGAFDVANETLHLAHEADKHNITATELREQQYSVLRSLEFIVKGRTI